MLSEAPHSPTELQQNPFKPIAGTRPPAQLTNPGPSCERPALAPAQPVILQVVGGVEPLVEQLQQQQHRVKPLRSVQEPGHDSIPEATESQQEQT